LEEGENRAEARLIPAPILKDLRMDRDGALLRRPRPQDARWGVVRQSRVVRSVPHLRDGATAARQLDPPVLAHS